MAAWPTTRWWCGTRLSSPTTWATIRCDPVRLDLTMRLARELGVLDRPGVRLVKPEPADDALLTLVHDPAYLDAVRAGAARPAVRRVRPGHRRQPDLRRHVRGERADRRRHAWPPPRRSGAARPRRAVNIAGGLHHAMPDRAAGLLRLQRRRRRDRPAARPGLRADRLRRRRRAPRRRRAGRFYDDPRVLTVSLHQTPLDAVPGHRLPGRDRRPGRARAARSTWRCRPAPTTPAGCARSTPSCPSVLRAFRPQMLVTQCGCDAHHEDPLADLRAAVDGQRATYRALHDARPRAVRRPLGRPRRRRVRAGRAACPGPGRTCSPRPAATRSTRPRRSRRAWRDDWPRGGDPGTRCRRRR